MHSEILLIITYRKDNSKSFMNICYGVDFEIIIRCFVFNDFWWSHSISLSFYIYDQTQLNWNWKRKRNKT